VRCRDRFKQRQMRARAKHADPAEIARLQARIAELEAELAKLASRP
jgi:BMFP domain-containing protein YqiC